MTSLICCNCQTPATQRVEEAERRVVGGFLTIEQVALIDIWLQNNGWNPDKSWLCPACLFFAMAELI